MICRFDECRPGNGVVFQTVLLMSDLVEGTDPLSDAVVVEFLTHAHLDRLELEECQRAVEKGHFGSWFPQVNSEDDFVVAPEIVALLRRPPYSELCLCIIREGVTGSVIWRFDCQNVC